MFIVKLTALENGAHQANNSDWITSVPDGWAMIPEDFPVPDTFPFVDIEAEEVTYYNEVEIPAQRKIPVLDEQGNPILDEDGNPLTETKEYTDKKQVPYTLMTVTDMMPGIVPEPEPEPEPEPTLDERNRADIDYLAVMMGVEL